MTRCTTVLQASGPAEINCPPEPSPGGRRRLAWALSRNTAVLLTPFLLLACADGTVEFPVTREQQAVQAADYDIVRLTSENVASFALSSQATPSTTLPPGGDWTYRLGIGDVLDVIIYDYPELTNPTGQTEARVGFRVQPDGTFFYPFIGTVQALGKTVDSVRIEMSERLTEFLPDPQVEVRVVGYNSQKVVVAGSVGTARSLPLTDVPLTLIDAINAAGAMQENADSERISVIRSGVPHRVNLDRFLRVGAPGDNPVLRAGDVVNVSTRQKRQAFVLGEVRTRRSLDLTTETLSLTQALTQVGWLSDGRADARGVFVFRNTDQRMQVFQLELSTPGDVLLGNAFALAPDDVVYITRNPLARWNDTVSRLVPIIRNPAFIYVSHPGR